MRLICPQEAKVVFWERRGVPARRKTLEHVMKELWRPMLFTTLTTCAGFASLALLWPRGDIATASQPSAHSQPPLGVHLPWPEHCVPSRIGQSFDAQSGPVQPLRQ